MKRIMITGSGGSAGIGFTRCLKAASEKMFLLGTDSNERYIYFAETNQRILIPSATSSEYIEILNEIIDKFKIEFLHAQPDIEISVISKNREKINTNVFLPSKKTVEICFDKFKCNRIWKKKNIPVAETIFIKNKKDLEKTFVKITPPLWIRTIKGAGGKGSLLVEKYHHAEAWIDYWDGWGKFTASEYLPGSNFGWDAIFKDGELICCQTKQRLEYALPGASPSGITGTTATAKSIKREDIDDIAKNAIYAVDKNPNGVFSVDLKENKNRIPHVTEINPGRFLTSSLHFFYKTKCLFPYLYVKLAYGEKILPDKIEQIPSGIILIRALDVLPKLLDEEKINSFLTKKKKLKYAVPE